MKKNPVILLMNGPNLNLLGTREPEKYGSTTLANIETTLRDLAAENGVILETFQSNFEGALIDRIHAGRGTVDAIIINPGAFTHTSLALADAIAGVNIPTVEIHLTNVYKREPIRHHSFIAPVAVGQISGFGAQGYELAFQAALRIVKA
jgi:3-dehydroquinate dehydratase II